MQRHIFFTHLTAAEAVEYVGGCASVLMTDGGDETPLSGMNSHLHQCATMCKGDACRAETTLWMTSSRNAEQTLRDHLCLVNGFVWPSLPVWNLPESTETASEASPLHT